MGIGSRGATFAVAKRGVRSYANQLYGGLCVKHHAGGKAAETTQSCVQLRDSSSTKRIMSIIRLNRHPATTLRELEFIHYCLV